MKITCISTVPSSGLAQAARKLREDIGLDLDLRIYYPHQIDEEKIDQNIFQKDLKTSDAVLVDIRGSGRSSDIVYQTLKDEKNIVINLVSPTGKIMAITRLGSFRGSIVSERIKPGEVRNPEEMWKRIQMAEKMAQTAGKLIPIGPVRDAANYIKITRYWRYGGQENYQNLLVLLLRDYLGCNLPSAKDPIEFPEYGIYHPDFGHFTELDEFLDRSGYDQALPTVGILFYGNMHFDQCQPTLNALLKKLEEFNHIPIYSDGIHNISAMKRFFFRDGKPLLDALVNLTLFRLNGGPLGGNHQLTKELLKELDVPVFTPASMYSREIEQWRKSETGLSPIEAIMAVIWPELDGGIEPIPCCGVQSLNVGDLLATNVVSIDDRVSRIAARIQNWIRLKRKANSEKKVAIIIYNYPPGEANLGRASYLDVFESVRILLENLKKEGYSVDLPDHKLHHIFQDQAAVNSGKWLHEETTAKRCYSLSADEYKKLFCSLPQKMQDDVVEAWGRPPGKVMVARMAEESVLLIPGAQFGNIFVGVQPARPPLVDDDLAKASHDKTKPPHHQYLAFYRWLENVWGADLVVHVGTHGLAEFMKGKEVGMSSECFPDRLIGDMPHLYFYHVLNTSEVVIAKRRLYGTILGYNSPAYTTSDLYGGYVELQGLIDEYSEAQVQHPQRCPMVRERIVEKAEELKLSGRDVEEIHEELYEMRRRIIPQGLHILGEKYDLEAKKRFLEFILRYDRNGIKSLNRILAEARGVDYDVAIRQRAMFAGELEAIDQACVRLADICIEKSMESSVAESGLSLKSRDELVKTLGYGMDLVDSYANNQQEIQNFIRGLETKHIEQASGGDVVRSPEVLPTGRNLTQFDPTRIPVSMAMERGTEIASNTLAKYLAKNGGYPETVGVILWGFETTKTGGESVGQILSYLGVTIVHDPGSWAPKLVALPLEDLGRPRIDCLVNICGFFRDMFPNIIQLLDKAFNLVTGLDEPVEMNYIKKHSKGNLERLRRQGKDESTARKLANGRIFGPRAGEYGTRMLPLVEDSIWRTEEELAMVYIQSMSHLYAENVHAAKSEDLYRANLARVEMVSQVRDSNDREIIDLDHYFEYFGGLSSAIRIIKGEDPEMLISDTTGEVIQTEDVKDVIARGARTRLLNPKWIDGMLEHEFHGAQQVAERLENMLGLAATTHSVDNWIWSSLAERYMLDGKMRERLVKNNRFAAAEIADRLFEAEKRGYWKATEEEMELLRNAYLDIEGHIEEG